MEISLIQKDIMITMLSDWNRVVFSKREGNTTINGITRNPIKPMVSNLKDKSVGLVLTSSTYEFSGIVFTTYYDTLALQDPVHHLPKRYHHQ